KRGLAHMDTPGFAFLADLITHHWNRCRTQITDLNPAGQQPGNDRPLDHPAGHVRVSGGCDVSSLTQVSSINGSNACGDFRGDFPITQPTNAVGAKEAPRPFLAPNQARAQYRSVFYAFVRPNLDVGVHDRALSDVALVPDDGARKHL